MSYLYSKGRTPVSWRKKDLQNRLAKSKRLLSGEEFVHLSPTGEEGIVLIKALCGLSQVISNANIPNTFLQILNLSKTAVVETNAVFERDLIRPISVGKIPDAVLNLIKPHTDNHERILKAAFEYDISLVYKAFETDPLVNERLTKSKIKVLANDMIKATIKYLPKAWDRLL